MTYCKFLSYRLINVYNQKCTSKKYFSFYLITFIKNYTFFSLVSIKTVSITKIRQFREFLVFFMKNKIVVLQILYSTSLID